MADIITPERAQPGAGPGASYHIASKLCDVPLYMLPAAGSRIENALRERAFDGQGVTVHASKFIGTYDQRSRFRVTDDGVAIVSIQGVLIDRGAWLGDMYGMATTYEGLAEQFARLEKDSAIKSVVLDIDSGGGMVAGLYDLVEVLGKLKKAKPVYALAANMAASAAYALASAADEVHVTRTGGVGSIGVIMIHQSYGRMLDAMGVDTTIICEPSPKADGNPYTPLSHGARAQMSGEITEAYQKFTAHVARHRGIAEADVIATQARMFTGEAAVSAGLADGVKSVEELLTMIRKSTDKPRASASRGARGSIRGGAPVARNDAPDEGTNYDSVIAEAMQALAASQQTLADSYQSLAKPQAAAPAAPATPPPPSAAQAQAAPAAADPKARVKAILDSEEAKTRPGLARHLALETDHDVTASIAILKVAAPEASGGTTQIYKAIAAAGGDQRISHADGTKPVTAADRATANIERQKARLQKKV